MGKFAGAVDLAPFCLDLRCSCPVLRFSPRRPAALLPDARIRCRLPSILGGHAPDKYTTGTLLGTSAARGWTGLLTERWRSSEGDLGEVEVSDTEIIVLIQGNLPIRRRGDGKLEHCHAAPGTVWLCPDGVREDMIRLYGEVGESVHLFLPASPLAGTAEAEIGVDPGKVGLRYEGGFRDPLIEQAARAIRAELIDPAPAGRMLAETLAAALGAHILRHHSNLNPASFPLPAARGALDPRRLRRIEDFIEAHLAEDLTIERLAGEACLSPFHFARAFKAATGTAPRGGNTMELTTERRDDVLSVRVSGRFDAAAGEAFEESLAESIAETDRAVILDLAGLDFIGSTGLRAVLTTAKTLHGRNAELVLCALSEPIRRVFRVTGFDRILPIHGTRAEALAALDG